MSSHALIPPERELPARRLAERADHLRAELHRSHPPRPRRRSIAIALAVLALGAVLLVTPAFGLRDQIAHLFGGKPPDVIERYFNNSYTGPNGPKVLAKQARLVVQVSVSGYGHQMLWVASTEGGGFCTTAPGCDPDRSAPLAPTLLVAGPTSRSAPDPRDPRDVHVFIEGDTLLPGAENLAAHYEDGSVDRTPIVWVAKPIDAGFFIYEVPKDHWDPGKRLVAVTAESADGRVLARDTKAAHFFRDAQKHNLALPTGVQPKPPPPPPQDLCADTCSDPEGDAGSTLDITKVKVTELGDDLEVELTVKGGADLQADDALVALDLDQNPDTGSAYYGTEVELALVGGENAREAEPVLYKARRAGSRDPMSSGSRFRASSSGPTPSQASTSSRPASPTIPTRHPTWARSRSSRRGLRTQRSGRTGVRPSSSPSTPPEHTAKTRSSSTGCWRAAAGRGRCSASSVGTGS